MFSGIVGGNEDSGGWGSCTVFHLQRQLKEVFIKTFWQVREILRKDKNQWVPVCLSVSLSVYCYRTKAQVCELTSMFIWPSGLHSSVPSNATWMLDIDGVTLSTQTSHLVNFPGENQPFLKICLILKHNLHTLPEHPERILAQRGALAQVDSIQTFLLHVLFPSQQEKLGGAAQRKCGDKQEVRTCFRLTWDVETRSTSCTQKLIAAQ